MNRYAFVFISFSVAIIYAVGATAFLRNGQTTSGWMCAILSVLWVFIGSRWVSAARIEREADRERKRLGSKGTGR